MLLALALASTVCFVGVGGFVGIKLLMLARRTRQLPELTVGIGFVLVAFLGYPLGLAALGLEGPVARVAFCVGTVAASVGSMSIYVFTWRVFRPEEPWARALAGAGMLGLAAVAVGSVVEGMHAERVTDPYLVHRQILVGVSYAWTAAESLRYWGLLRRRLVLGLADPLVANRFLLWALSGLFASGASPCPRRSPSRATLPPVTRCPCWPSAWPASPRA